MKFKSENMAPANKHWFPAQSGNNGPLAFTDILFLHI